MIPTILLLKIFLATWYFTDNDYIQETINHIFKKINTDKLPKTIDAIHIIFGCHKCLSFFVTLTITLNIWLALGVSFIVYVTSKI